MDPLSQGLLGAAAAQTAAKSDQIRIAAGAGFFGGIIADSDVFIRSAEDPLLAIEFHRQFTHSMFFIPFGGLIGAAFLWPLLKRKLSFGKVYRYATLGFATSGILDAYTSYGTQLLWPLSSNRIAWNVVSIIDPIFTGTLLLSVLAGFAFRRVRVSQAGFALAMLYLCFGVYQRERAEDAIESLATARGHGSQRLTAKPAIGNLLLWRGIYESGGRIYVDAMQMGIFGDPTVYEGGSIEKFDVSREFPELSPESTLYRDIERFSWFSDWYVAFHPDRPDVLGDVRYSEIPNRLKPLWGIRVDTTKPDEHVPFLNFENVGDGDFKILWRMIRGRPLEAD